MKKLPEPYKEKLVEALRSNEYEQCFDRLLSDHGAYCVIGVAAEGDETDYQIGV